MVAGDAAPRCFGAHVAGVPSGRAHPCRAAAAFQRERPRDGAGRGVGGHQAPTKLAALSSRERSDGGAVSGLLCTGCGSAGGGYMLCGRGDPSPAGAAWNIEAVAAGVGGIAAA